MFSCQIPQAHAGFPWEAGFFHCGRSWEKFYGFLHLRGCILVLPPWTLHSIGRPGISMRGERNSLWPGSYRQTGSTAFPKPLGVSKQVDSPSSHRQHNVELLGKEANRMGIGDLRENIYVHASPKCERRISMEHVSSHPAICTNVFKNGDATTSKAAFTRKWIEMINRIEKNKQLQYGKIQ